MRIPRVCSVLTLVAIFCAGAFGQGVASGDLRVTVKDPNGSLVTNASVTVRDEEKGIERPASVSGEGQYSFLSLPPGSYAVTVSAQGFANASAAHVVITVGGVEDLPIALSIASTTETVQVSSESELVETSRTSTTDTVNQRAIDNLPINGRNYINFTLTDSQVVRDNAPNTGAAPTSGLNMSGQRARSNLVNVDGADATDNSVNGVRSTVSQEDVQEFQIITNGYSPEYGRAAGGVVNIVTKSGSNNFHGDVFGYLRNRNFQAVNPFSTVSDPAYTRVQAGAAFGGAIKKDKTFYFFSYEITRRHETGFSDIGADNFGLVPFDTTQIGMPFGTLQLTPQQVQFLTDPANLTAVQGCPVPNALVCPFTAAFFNYAALAGASSSQAINGKWPTALVQGETFGALSSWAGFPTSCQPPGPCLPVPASYQTLASQVGNFPVFEGTSLYSFRIDHNATANNRITLRANVSPSTVTGIEVGGEDQPFGQNAYSRTSEQTYRDVAGVAQDTWTIGNNKLNEFRFQYARRGLSYFYNTASSGGSDPAVNIPGFAYFGREPYSYIQRTETRYQFTDNFSWTLGRHSTKFGADLNYIPLKAIFTVNYGGVYDFGQFAATNFFNPALCPNPQDCFAPLSAVQAYGAGLPGDYVQGLGSPSDSFHNIPIGLFWQDSWRASPNLTLNYGLRYDVEIPPSFAPPTGLAATGYNFLGLQKGIQTDTNNLQPRIGIAWDPNGDGKTVVRSSYGIFYDHPLLGLYFLGNASDGSSSGQLAFGGTGLCSGAGQPGNLNAFTIFQGLVPGPGGNPASPCSPASSAAGLALLNYSPSQQRFSCPTADPSCGVTSPANSIFLSQNFLNPANFLPLGFQPFGYPQAKNFVYAYSQQANLTVERDLGHGYALSLAYNFNGGRHLNRPINANTERGDLLVRNLNAAVAGGAALPTDSPLGVSACGVGAGGPYVPAALTNFFRPSGTNASIALALLSSPFTAPCVTTVLPLVQQEYHLNANCNLATLANCIPFGDMDANYSNGSSDYNGFSANLRKRFTDHYEFLASYTWSHAIDDSTDLESTLTPQDSYYPGLDRSTSLFDQRNRFVFSGVYQSGHFGGGGFAHVFLSDWTVAPLIEFGSGRPFNIITGNGDNLQLSSLTSRPNTFVNPGCTALGYTPVQSKYSPTGVFQEPCIADFNGSLLSLDGNLARNAGTTPWTVFNDLRIARNLVFRERLNLELSVDIFNLANRYNVAAVSPLFTNAGQATAAYDPRQFQFGMKMKW